MLRKYCKLLINDIIQSLKNAFVNQNEGQTALHFAAITGEESFIKFLHMNGANPNIQDKLERTPLHLATENGHMKAVDFLTEKFKASVHERTKVSIK